MLHAWLTLKFVLCTGFRFQWYSHMVRTHLDAIISRSQSAFIKKRSIHDNFLFTQNLIREQHRCKKPILFLKLDIAKAFDTVKCDYLLEVSNQLGFGVKWRSWVSTLLASANSSIILNGTRGKSFRHRRGLRQGDPLSPMLFIITFDPLQKLLQLATQEGVLQPIQNETAKLRISMYADDAALFLNPTQQEVMAIKDILTVFGEAWGLITNLNKCAVYPIRCEEINLEEIMHPFPCAIQAFPCQYLGLSPSLGLKWNH